MNSRTLTGSLRIRLLLYGLIIAATGGSALTAYAESAPPRSIDDVLKVLEHYKPDPTDAQQAREAAERQPPNTTDAVDLAKFYLERARAAQRIGRVAQGSKICGSRTSTDRDCM